MYNEYFFLVIKPFIPMKKILCFLAAISLSSCTNLAENSAMAASEPRASEAAAAVDSAYVAVEASEMNIPTKDKGVAIPDHFDPQIIKSADLSFETENMDETYNRIITTVKKYSAVVQDDTEGTDESAMYRRMQIRVPSKNFDAFVAGIGNGVSYFERKQISAEDVTEEYIDVQARIKAKKALEERYLQLLQKAGKVSEMLEVEQQLSQIREEIEAKEARLNFIKTRVAMSSVLVEFHKPFAQKREATVSFGRKIINAFGTGFNTISYFFIRILEDWPFWTVVTLLLLWLRRRIKTGKSIWPFGKKQNTTSDET